MRTTVSDMVRKIEESEKTSSPTKLPLQSSSISQQQQSTVSLSRPPPARKPVTPSRNTPPAARKPVTPSRTPPPSAGKPVTPSRALPPSSGVLKAQPPQRPPQSPPRRLTRPLPNPPTRKPLPSRAVPPTRTPPVKKVSPQVNGSIGIFALPSTQPAPIESSSAKEQQELSEKFRVQLIGIITYLSKYYKTLHNLFEKPESDPEQAIKIGLAEYFSMKLLEKDEKGLNNTLICLSTPMKLVYACLKALKDSEKCDKFFVPQATIEIKEIAVVISQLRNLVFSKEVFFEKIAPSSFALNIISDGRLSPELSLESRVRNDLFFDDPSEEECFRELTGGRRTVLTYLQGVFVEVSRLLPNLDSGMQSLLESCQKSDEYRNFEKEIKEIKTELENTLKLGNQYCGDIARTIDEEKALQIIFPQKGQYNNQLQSWRNHSKVGDILFIFDMEQSQWNAVLAKKPRIEQEIDIKKPKNRKPKNEKPKNELEIKAITKPPDTSPVDVKLTDEDLAKAEVMAAFYVALPGKDLSSEAEVMAAVKRQIKLLLRKGSLFDNYTPIIKIEDSKRCSMFLCEQSLKVHSISSSSPSSPRERAGSFSSSPRKRAASLKKFIPPLFSPASSSPVVREPGVEIHSRGVLQLMLQLFRRQGMTPPSEETVGSAFPTLNNHG